MNEANTVLRRLGILYVTIKCIALLDTIQEISHNIRGQISTLPIDLRYSAVPLIECSGAVQPVIE